MWPMVDVLAAGLISGEGLWCHIVVGKESFKEAEFSTHWRTSLHIAGHNVTFHKCFECDCSQEMS